MGRRRAGEPGQLWSPEWLEVTGRLDTYRKGDVGSHEGKPLFQGFPTLLGKRTNPSQDGNFAVRRP